MTHPRYACRYVCMYVCMHYLRAVIHDHMAIKIGMSEMIDGRWSGAVYVHNALTLLRLTSDI